MPSMDVQPLALWMGCPSPKVLMVQHCALRERWPSLRGTGCSASVFWAHTHTRVGGLFLSPAFIKGSIGDWISRSRDREGDSDVFRMRRKAVIEAGWRRGRLSEHMASAGDQLQPDPTGSSEEPRAGLSWRQRKPAFCTHPLSHWLEL